MPRDSERTDGELLAAVVGFLLRETGDREATADLSAEVFAAIFLVAKRFRARGAGSARPWVLGIARNKLLESRRHGRVEDRARRRLAFEPEVLDDDDLARVDELAGAANHPVLGLVEQLPEGQRDAVRSRVVDEREYGEIARDMKCSELVARQRVSRGLARLRDQLTEGER